MQSQSESPVRSFSIGFREDRFNEAEYAKAVARHLGTDHTDLYVEPADALDVIPDLADCYDEPFADSSQIPTMLLSRLTRRHVTVALSGDGGDEVFAGYSRYFWADIMWRSIRRAPYRIRRGAAQMLRLLPSSTWARLLQVAPRRVRPGRSSYKASTLPELLAARDADDLYRRLVTFWRHPPLAGPAVQEPSNLLDEKSDIPDFISRMQFYDTASYLPDDILTKVDRASMAASLEARVPILDHRVVELAWKLPLAMKYRNGTSKWILRRVLSKYVPDALIERPKAGFAVPIQSWLRGPLREWAEALLNERRLREDGLFDATIVRRRWTEYVEGAKPSHELLWGVLMFQAWKERWLEGAADPRRGTGSA
jgi:asparagine synthase (glutamine-hydrolysing)